MNYARVRNREVGPVILATEEIGIGSGERNRSQVLGQVHQAMERGDRRLRAGEVRIYTGLR